MTKIISLLPATIEIMCYLIALIIISVVSLPFIGVFGLWKEWKNEFRNQGWKDPYNDPFK